MSEIVLETERLVLRTWDEHYGRLLDKHCNTDAVMEHLGGPQSPKKHSEMVKWLIDQQNNHGTTFWVMETKERRDFLGFCGLVKVDEIDSTVLGCTEIGWRLRADDAFRRKGFVKEAAKASFKFAFENRKELRVVSRTTLGNVASWNLMQDLGMWHDPRLDYYSTKDDDNYIVHVLTNED